MKIGASGTSGHLGKTVLRRLVGLSADPEVIGASRSPESVESGVESRFGDYDVLDRLREAYAGLDRLLIIPTLYVTYDA